MESPVASGTGGPAGSEAPVLETERLRLRPYLLDDFEAFATYFASGRARYTDGPVGRAVAWDRFASGAGNWGLRGYGAWSVERLADARLVGLVSLNPPLLLPATEMGWILYSASDEGQGYAVEAAARARDFAFGLPGVSELLSGIRKDNRSSIALAGRLGAVVDPALRVEGEPETLVFRHVCS